MSRVGTPARAGTVGEARGVRAAAVVIGAVLAVGLGPDVPARGAEPGVDARFGVGGLCRTGAWTPLTIRSDPSANGRVRGWVEDPDGQWVGSPPAAFHETADGRKQARLSLRPGRSGGRVRIQWRPEDDLGEAAAEAAGSDAVPSGGEVASTTSLILLVGDLTAATGAARLVAGDARPPVIVDDGAARDMILDPRDLDGFEVVIVCGRRVGELPAATGEAIDRWVRQGGKLVLAAGRSAVGIAAGGAPTADWLPGTSPRLVPLKRFGAIEAYARSGGLTGRAPAAGIQVPRFEGGAGVSGMVDAFEGASAADLPLVVRRAHGFGTITWIGIDIDERWCADWPGCDRLIAGLLGGREERDTASPSAEDGRRVPDLAGQLRVALDSFTATEPATRPVPFEIIAALGALYALALFPLDWWLVTRSGRPWLSWLSLPLLAGGFTAVAWATGGLWGRDRPAEAQVADVIDFDAAGGLARGFSWAAVRSPANDRLDLSVNVEPVLATGEATAAVSWFADAGAGFGGVDAAIAHPSLAAREYAYGDSLANLRGVPIAAASSRLFEAEWTAAMPTAVATSSLVRDPRGLLAGAVSHHLPFRLDDCWLLHAGWLYDVGRMEPGTAYDTKKGRGPRSLAAALTRRTAKWEADRAERWNVADADVGRILQVAGLHAAAGGSGYTSLQPGRLGRLDLSPSLLVDRAVLVGRAAASIRGTSWRLKLGSGQGGTRGRGGPGDDGLDLDPLAADRGSLVRIILPLPAAGGSASEGGEIP